MIIFALVTLVQQDYYYQIDPYQNSVGFFKHAAHFDITEHKEIQDEAVTTDAKENIGYKNAKK